MENPFKKAFAFFKTVFKRQKKNLLDSLIVFGVTFVLIFLLKVFKSEPPKRISKLQTVPLVKVVQVKPFQGTLLVYGYGIVKPHSQTQLKSELFGRLEILYDAFEEGIEVKKATPLLKINDVDALRKVAEAKAKLAAMKVEWKKATAEVKQAKGNFDLLYTDSTQADPLAFKIPQQESAKANLEMAQALLKSAQQSLARTIVRAPYDGVIIKRDVDSGDLLQQGTLLGTIYDNQSFKVRVPLSLQKLFTLNLNTHLERAQKIVLDYPVTLFLYKGDQSYAFKGKLVRLEAQYHNRSQLIDGIIQVSDKESINKDFILQSGLFVKVLIEGPTSPNAYVLPVEALRSGNFIYLVTPENKLDRHEVSILSITDRVFIFEADIKGDVQVVYSPLDRPVQGMQLRLHSESSH